MLLTRENDSIIGERLGPLGQLEVVGVLGTTAAGKRVYKVLCHICKDDAELFGDGVFSGTLSNLKRYPPCGCAKNPRWSQRQYEVKIKRMCAQKGYTYIEFKKVGKSARDSVIKVHCNSCVHTWTPRLSDFLSGRGCPECAEMKRSAARTRPDASLIKEFMMSGLYPDGAVFYRSATNKRVWIYRCPICAVDEYSREGLCSGEFKSTGASLKRQMPCRCSKAPILTAAQLEFRIRKSLCMSGQGYEFLKWVNSEHRKTNSKALLLCPKHGEWQTNVGDVLYGSHGCPSCSKTGFDPSKTGVVYILKIEGASADFTGYGISNVIKQRLARHKQKLSEYGFQIVESTIFEMAGSDAVLVEKMLKENLAPFPQEPRGFRTEATYAKLYSHAIFLVQQYVDTLKFNLDGSMRSTPQESRVLAC